MQTVRGCRLSISPNSAFLNSRHHDGQTVRRKADRVPQQVPIAAARLGVFTVPAPWISDDFCVVDTQGVPVALLSSGMLAFTLFRGSVALFEVFLGLTGSPG